MADGRSVRLVLLGLAAAAVCAGCASTGAVAKPSSPPARAAKPGAAAGPAPVARHGRGLQALVGTALDLRGRPYRNGGSDPGGFDCSGFTHYVFAQHGVGLPRETRDQFTVGRKVRGDPVPGDLLFFATTDRGPSHVAISMGSDRFVHAPSSSGQVRIERLSTEYWARRYLGARRVTLP